MATASLPTRTRSIRKPSTGIDLKPKSNGLSSEVVALDAPAPRSRGGDAIGSTNRGSQSPTRLPMRPPSSSSSSARITRAGSLQQRTAPSSTLPGPSDGSMRPPPRSVTTRPPLSSDNNKSSVSRPPLTSDNHKGPSTRTGSRTPTEQSSSTGLQRRPSTRHTRTTSTGSVSSIQPPTTKHVRNASISQLNSTTTLRPPSETKQAPNPALHRPVFSTLQQHYSPAKSIAPKPTAASLLAAPSPSKLPSNIAISTETSRLQAELLQLHLLHRDAAPVQAQWRDSARNKLGERFEALVRKHEGLVAQEEAQHDKVNARALKVWADNGIPGWGLEEKMQVLDEVITGVWGMGESGGKYARIVRRFEKWMRTVVDTQHWREKGRFMDGDEVMFIEDIDANWGDDCRVQARRLEEWRDKLADLGKVEVKSSLATVVDGCGALVRGMLDELDIMRRIEKEVMRSERDWIKEMIGDSGEDEEVSVHTGPAWHRT